MTSLAHGVEVAVMIAAPALILSLCLKDCLDFPILGGTLPVIRRRRLPLNRDGSYVDTGEANLHDEVGFYFIQVWVFEWLGFGLPLTSGYVQLTSTGEIVDPDFDTAGG